MAVQPNTTGRRKLSIMRGTIPGGETLGLGARCEFERHHARRLTRRRVGAAVALSCSAQSVDRNR
jgi:hypothetical protein